MLPLSRAQLQAQGQGALAQFLTAASWTMSLMEKVLGGLEAQKET